MKILPFKKPENDEDLYVDPWDLYRQLTRNWEEEKKEIWAKLSIVRWLKFVEKEILQCLKENKTRK